VAATAAKSSAAPQSSAAMTAAAVVTAVAVLQPSVAGAIAAVALKGIVPRPGLVAACVT